MPMYNVAFSIEEMINEQPEVRNMQIFPSNSLDCGP